MGIADDDNNGAIDFNEFKKLAAEHVMDWTESQTKEEFEHFDKDNSGAICYDEFLYGLRGDMNERRKQLVLIAFEILDKNKSGAIDLDDITEAYDASKHPDVISGKRTATDVLREFLDTI